MTLLLLLAQIVGPAPFRIADESTTLAARPILAFLGTTVSCAVNGARIECTFTGGSSSGHTIQDEGSSLTARTNLNFVGSNIACTDDAGNDQTDCTVGTIAIAGGGTGQTTATAAFNGLDPLTTRGDMLTHDGTDSIRLALGSIYQAPVSNGTDLSYLSIGFMMGFLGASGFTTSSTSYVDVTGLTIALAANQLFAFECYGTFTTSDNASGTTNGLGLSLNGTGGTNQASEYTIWIQTTATNTSGNNTTSTTPFSIRNENSFDSMTALTSVVSVATSLRWMMKGFYYTGTSGTSTMAVRVRSENGSPQTAKIQVGSYCLMTKQG